MQLAGAKYMDECYPVQYVERRRLWTSVVGNDMSYHALTENDTDDNSIISICMTL